jgi:hypothetical protein
VAAALVIATQNFTEPGVAVMLLVTTLAGLVVLLVAARWFARRDAPGGGAEPAAARPELAPQEAKR